MKEDEGLLFYRACFLRKDLFQFAAPGLVEKTQPITIRTDHSGAIRLLPSLRECGLVTQTGDWDGLRFCGQMS